MPGAFNLNDAETLEDFLARKRNGIPAGCVMHRRECFTRYGYWDDTLPACGDWDMWARIIEGGRRENFAYLGVPTQLHFLANWRRMEGGQSSEREVWKKLHAVGHLVSPALKVPVPAGLAEQEAIWRVMAANPRKWARDLRVAVQRVLDHRATELGRIQRSSLWKLFRWLRSIILRLAPPGTLRERLWRRLAKAASQTVVKERP